MKRVVLATLAALAAGAVSAAEPLGRLFFSPEQRAQMDIARAQRSRATLAAEIEQEAAPETLTYHGIVRRSDGKDTVWINDRAINDGKDTGRLPPARPRPDGSIVLELPQSERKVNLKVGQSVELLSGTIAEPYARQPVPPKPAPNPDAGKSAAPGAAPAKKEVSAASAEQHREKEQMPTMKANEGSRAPPPEAAAGHSR